MLWWFVYDNHLEYAFIFALFCTNGSLIILICNQWNVSHYTSQHTTDLATIFLVGGCCSGRPCDNRRGCGPPNIVDLKTAHDCRLSLVIIIHVRTLTWASSHSSDVAQKQYRHTTRQQRQKVTRYNSWSVPFSRTHFHIYWWSSRTWFDSTDKNPCK